MADIDYPVNRADANLEYEKKPDAAHERERQEATTVVRPFETHKRAGMTREEVRLKIETEKKWARAERDRRQNAKEVRPEKRKDMEGVDVVNGETTDIPL